MRYSSKAVKSRMMMGIIPGVAYIKGTLPAQRDPTHYLSTLD